MKRFVLIAMMIALFAGSTGIDGRAFAYEIGGGLNSGKEPQTAVNDGMTDPREVFDAVRNGNKAAVEDMSATEPIDDVPVDDVPFDAVPVYAEEIIEEPEEIQTPMEIIEYEPVETEAAVEFVEVYTVSEDGYTAVEIFDLFSEGTVHIETSSGGGTGFFITDELIVTNNHVISGAEWITVKTVDGEVYDVTSIIARSDNPDLALLLVEGYKGVGLPLNSGEVREGEAVYTIGAPMGIFPCISDGIVMKSSHIDNDVDYILTDIHSIGGNSGGPVFNARGEVIGVVVGGMVDGPNSIDMVINAKYIADMDIGSPEPVATKAEWQEKLNAPE